MSSEFKGLIAVALIGVVLSLGKAMFHMASGPDESGQVVRALTMRISLSIAVFVILCVGYHFGMISPHAVAH